MNISQILWNSFCGNPDEIREAENILLNTEPTLEFCQSFFQIIEGNYPTQLRISALIRIVQIIRNGWKEKLSQPTKDLIFQHFIIILNNYDNCLEKFILLFSDYMVAAFFNGEFDFLINLLNFSDLQDNNFSKVNALLILSYSISKHLKHFFTETKKSFYLQFSTQFISTFLKYYHQTTCIPHLSLILKTITNLCHKDIYSLVINNSELFTILFTKEELLQTENEFSISFIKFIRFILRSSTLPNHDQTISLFNCILNLFKQDISPKLIYYSSLTLSKLIKSEIIWGLIQSNFLEFFKTFLFPFFIINDEDKNDFVYNPLEFITNIFPSYLSLYDKRSAISYVILSIAERYNEFPIFVSNITLEIINSNSEDFIFSFLCINYLIIDKLPLEILSNLIFIYYNLINCDSALIKAAAFRLVSIINVELPFEFFILALNHLNNEFYIVKFFAAKEISSYLINVKEKKEEILGFCVPNFNFLFETLIQLLLNCFEIQLIPLIKIYIKYFNDFIIPYSENLSLILFAIFNDEISSIDNESLHKISKLICKLQRNYQNKNNLLVNILNCFPNYNSIIQSYVIEIIVEILNTSNFDPLFWQIINVIPKFVYEQKNECYQDEMNLLKVFLVNVRKTQLFDLNCIDLLFQKSFQIFVDQKEEDYSIALQIIGYIFVTFIGNGNLLEKYVQNVLKILNNCINFSNVYSELSFLISSLILYNVQIINLFEERVMLLWLENCDFPYFVVPALYIFDKVNQDLQKQILIIVYEQISDETNYKKQIYENFPEYTQSEVLKFFCNFVEKLKIESPLMYQAFSDETFPFLQEKLPFILNTLNVNE